MILHAGGFHTVNIEDILYSFVLTQKNQKVKTKKVSPTRFAKTMKHYENQTSKAAFQCFYCFDFPPARTRFSSSNHKLQFFNIYFLYVSTKYNSFSCEIETHMVNIIEDPEFIEGQEYLNGKAKRIILHAGGFHTVNIEKIY